MHQIEVAGSYYELGLNYGRNEGGSLPRATIFDGITVHRFP